MKITFLLHKIVTGILLFFFSTSVFGKQYFFSTTNGDDSNTGITSYQAWRSIEKLNKLLPQLKAGDVVLFERGSRWYEAKINMNNVHGSEDNPIVFKSYGTGDLPKITGAKNVSGLFSNDGNEWYVKNIGYSLRDYLRTNAGLLINGKFHHIARYPNDGSWWTTESTGQTSLSDPEQNWSDNEWTGSNVVARCVPYGVEISEITSNTSSSLDFETFKYYSLRQSTNPTYYYISNANQGLSENGEWTYRNGTLRVYYTSDLNQKTVEFPVIDTVFNMTGSSFIVFDGIKFENANAIIMHLYDSDNVTFKNCTIRVAGNTGIRTKKSTNLVLRNNYLEYFHENGVAMDNGSSTITDNVFKHISAVWGHNNTAGSDKRSGAAITPWYSEDYNYIRYNVFDSISQAMNSHSSNQTWYFERNLVRTFGVTRGGDIGALYTGGDWRADVPKYVRKNIFINGVQDLSTITGGHSTRYTHMIYWDYSSRGIIVDSNTVDGVSVALYSNCSEFNRFQDNLIVDATRDLDSYWNSVFYFDASGDNTGCNGISDNTISRNTIVFGDNNNQKGTIWRTDGDAWFPNFTFDNNTYQNPFNNTIVPHRKVVSFYSSSEDYSQSDICSSNNWDCNSVWQPLKHTYDNTTGISKDQFVNVFYNASKETRDITLPARYIDLEGNFHENYVTLKPYESIVLFYYEKSKTTNMKPIINDQTINVYQNDYDDLNIGIIEASDPNYNQQLSYTITDGNDDNLFSINNNGELSFSSNQVTFTNSPSYNLTVSVNDNGSPTLSSNAKITVNLFEEEIIASNSRPIIENQHFQVYSHQTTDLVGTILASDQDSEQVLSYLIISGNDLGYFELDKNNGNLYLSHQNMNFDQNEKFSLSVMVEDNFDNPLRDTAIVIINFIESNSLYYIDPENINDAYENGTLEHPYDNLSDIPPLRDDSQVLLKSGTSINIEQFEFTANGVTLTSYGKGKKPVIRSNTSEHVIKAFDKKDITIKNIEFQAENAISSIYFYGDECENNTIECCDLIGSEYGIRMIDAQSYNVLYSAFQTKMDAIFSISNYANIHYNIFKGTNTAINIGSNSIAAHIFNNVFYNNKNGISSVSAEIVAYNNIFNLENPGDLAIRHESDEIVSDHNIFYPEMVGFIYINGNEYNTIEDIQDNLGFDINSLTIDPAFNNTENFELSVTSPAIDAGKYVGIFKDFFGVAVPYGKNPDIGCKEAKSTNSNQNNNQITDITTSKAGKSFVYPNPNNGAFNIFISDDLSLFDRIEIVNTTGQIVYTEDLKQQLLNSIVRITLSGIEPGIYFVKLINASESEIEKIIIQ